MKTTFYRYFSYRLEKGAMRTVVLSILSVLLTHVVIQDVLEKTKPQSGLYILAIILGTLCTLVPMCELADLKNKRNLDTLCFLPISRQKMSLVHFLCGWLQVVIPYSISFAYAYTKLIIKADQLALGYLLPYYFLSLCVGLVMYAFFLFLFGEANTVLDGVIFCALGIFVLYMFLGILSELLSLIPNAALTKWLTDVHFSRWYPSWMIAYAPINNLTVLFQDAVEMRAATANREGITEAMHMFAVWGVIGLGCIAGFFIRFLKFRVEQVEGISRSWLGYRLMIPIFGYSLMYQSPKISDYFYVLALILILVGYFIYRRGFRLKWSDVLVTLGSILPLLLYHATHTSFM